MSEHERIWLEPICCEQIPEGRHWCQDRLDDCDELDCGEKAVEFVRADIVAAKDAEIARLRELLSDAPEPGEYMGSPELKSLSHGARAFRDAQVTWLGKARASLNGEAGNG